MREAHFVADRWAKHLRIGSTFYCVWHSRLPVIQRGQRLRQRSHDRLVESINQALASVRDETNFTRLARLEAHSRSRRNVQAISESRLSVKGESRVGLGEMIVTADLDRSVARVRDSKRNRCFILIKDNVSRCWKYLARYHVSPQSKRFRPTLLVRPLRVVRPSRSNVRRKTRAKCR